MKDHPQGWDPPIDRISEAKGWIKVLRDTPEAALEIAFPREATQDLADLLEALIKEG